MAKYGLKTLLSSVPSNASATSSPVNAEDLACVRFLAHVTTTSAPVGTLSFEATEDADLVAADVAAGTYGGGSETARWVPLTLPAGAVHLTGGATFTGPAASVAIDTTSTAAKVLVILADLPARIRAKWTRSSGGSAGGGVTVRVAGK